LLAFYASKMAPDTDGKQSDQGQLEVHEAEQVSNGSSGGREVHRPHHLEVVPIEEEAHQGDVHINLSWRSWVRSALPFPPCPL
jgi:hypothetical protein